MCKFWECRNAHCLNYGGNGIRLGPEEIEQDPFRRHACKRCGTIVRESTGMETPLSKTLAWTALGVMLGVWAEWGPTGILLGAAAGLLLCLLTEL